MWKIKLDFTYKIFVCNHCFETWLLGNSSLFPSDNVGKNKSFWIYYNHYNVKENDPENMLPPIDVQSGLGNSLSPNAYSLLSFRECSSMKQLHHIISITFMNYVGIIE